MNKILTYTLVSLLVLAGVETARAQTVEPASTDSVAPAAPAAETVTETAPVAETAPPAGPYRSEPVAQAPTPCVRQVNRIAPPPSPRSFRRQWPLAAVGSVVGWLVADRVVGPQGSKFVILSSSTLGSIAGSHFQASREGHANLGRSVMGGVLGAFPAGAVLWMNGADVYNEAEFATRGIVPVLGGALQAGVTSMVTSSSLQPTRIQIIECPHVPTATASIR